MPLSANHIYFFVSYAVAFLVFGFIGKWYLWPAIRERAPGIALKRAPAPARVKRCETFGEVSGPHAALRWDIQPRDRGDSTNE